MNYEEDRICLRVGELKRALEGLPDDMPVVYQRIEDYYFKEAGWETIPLLWEIEKVPNNQLDSLTDDEIELTQMINGTLYIRQQSEYICAFSAYKHSEEDVFVINAHY